MISRIATLNLLALCGLVFPFSHQALAANKISDGRVTLDSPVSAADVVSIRALKSWPGTLVQLDKAATDEVLVSLSQLPDIRYLSLGYGNSQITSLSPLAQLPALGILEVRSMKFPSGELISVAPLAKCTELAKVTFFATRIKDVDALRACPKLKEVNLYMAAVDSLDFLAATPDVTSLNLYGFKHTFSSYETVSELSRLRELNIYMNTQATDANLSVLSKLTTLRKVDMANSKEATTLGFLANCHDMEEIDAKWSRSLRDISALGGMPYLTKVQLDKAPIRDLNALAGKAYLTYLDISATAVTDLSPLQDSIYLEYLNLEESEVVDLTPLGKIVMLKSLNLSKTRVTDLSPLKSQRRLAVLDLDNSAVTDLGPLAELSTLRTLSIDRTGVTDLTPLYGLLDLQTITLARTVPDEQIEALKRICPKVSVQLR